MSYQNECEHDPAGCCWLCSDQVSWWKEARIKAGLGEEPPNAPRFTVVEDCTPYPCSTHTITDDVIEILRAIAIS